MPTDKQLVSKDEHEIKYILKKWHIKKADLLALKGKKRSRKEIEKILVEAGIPLRIKKVKNENAPANEQL